MKKIVYLVVSCLLLLSLCACSSEPSLVGTTPVGNNSSTETPTVAKDAVFKLGDSVELDGIVVSFIALDKSNGSDFNKPADGNEFLLCEFEITNNSNEDISISSMLSFEAYHDDYSCDTSFSAMLEKGNKEQLDGTIAAGKKMKGIIGYEVPTDWEELEIHYTPNILSDNKIVFVATNN